MVPYVVGDVTTQPVEAGNPLRETTDPDGSARRRSEIRAASRPHADRHGQSRLRSGRSGSGRRQPVRVRDVLLGASAVLRRRLRHLSASTSTATTATAAGCSTRGASAARRAVRAGRSRRRLFRRAGADDDPRRGEADRPRRRVLDWRAQCRHRRRGRGDRRTASQRTRQTIEPLTSYSVVRARREFAEPVRARLHHDGDQPQPR